MSGLKNTNPAPASTSHPNSQIALSPGLYAAQVCEVDALGRVRKVITEEGHLLVIDDQCASLPRASMHDRCLITPVDSRIMVTQILLGERAPFSVSQVGNKLTLAADQQYESLEIRAGNTSLELCSNGIVKLHGRKVNASADEHFLIKGDRIDLNMD